MKIRHYLQRAAFTLLEMSVVFVIIGVVAGGAMVIFNQSVDRRQMVETQTKLRDIQKALEDFRIANNRLPCPANVQTAMSAAGFGSENSSSGNDCAGTNNILLSGAAAYSGAPQVYIGMVPTRTLKLPDDAAIDAWGRRIMYAVDNNFAATDAFTNIAPDDTTTRIIVKDASGTDIATGKQSISYVVLSYGADGHGGYPRTGGSTRIANNSGGSDELTNCHCDASVASSLSTPRVSADYTFIQKSDTLSGFDDVLLYGTRSGSQYFPPVNYTGGTFTSALQNSGFENTTVANNSSTANPSGAVWSFTGTSGIVDGYALGSPNAAGAQSGYVGASGMIAQTFFLNAGSYTLGYQAANSGSTQALEVVLDGTQVGSDVSINTSYYKQYQTTLTVTTAGNHTIAFRGDSANSGYIFIDNVSLLYGLASLPALATPTYVTSGILGWWKFDEGSGLTAVDSAANYGVTGHNGTLGGSPVPTWTTGQLGGALNYSGAQSLNTNASSSVFMTSTTNPFTITVWVNPSQISASPIGNRIINLHRGATAGSGFALALGASNRIQYYNGADGVTSNFTNTISTNAWTHVAMTYDGTTFRPYVNGVADSGTRTIAHQAGGSFSVYIGTFDATQLFYYGKIDDVRIYNRALTAQEVSDIYNGQ